MPVIKINDNTMRFHIGALTAEVSTSSQYVTVFCNDKPMGSLSRRRVIDKGCEWSVFDLDGKKLGEHNMVSPCLHMLRRDLVEA